MVNKQKANGPAITRKFIHNQVIKIKLKNNNTMYRCPNNSNPNSALFSRTLCKLD